MLFSVCNLILTQLDELWTTNFGSLDHTTPPSPTFRALPVNVRTDPRDPTDRNVKLNKIKTEQKKLTHQKSINIELTTTNVSRCTLSLDAGNLAWRNPLQGGNIVRFWYLLTLYWQFSQFKWKKKENLKPNCDSPIAFTKNSTKWWDSWGLKMENIFRSCDPVHFHKFTMMRLTKHKHNN